MKAKEVMKILNISRNTLSTYVKNGHIKIEVLPTGRYIYDEDSVFALIGKRKEKHGTKIISYSRVSTQKQKS